MTGIIDHPMLEFAELDAMDAPDNGTDWIRGFNIGFAITVIAVIAT